MPTREELRQRLKERRRGLRDGTTASTAQTLKKDPMTAMLAMGIDDPEVLKHAKAIVKNPTSFLKSMASETPIEGDDDEEAPPPLTSS